ncbi:glutathione S-transferase [Hahella sp. CCB-MM4]|uniref:glutathione S-transferase family protein n=1 Tax=Hahella sp. (strain CCB-MM4) TaxID=1926491 RepID=UPI000B9C60CB|nr:glutathione S-transferase family protein [Hahella sp. CCB-MM4]OZG71882.1 glutathione S-transferase [Hahella sp. CCB-MM4]
MILHDYRPSGNGYKARLLMHLLEIEYEYREYDIIEGATHTPDFLKLNPNGKIPVLELDDGTIISESNAIIFYLSQGTSFWPESLKHQTEVMQWLFFEQYSHEPNVASPRFWLTHLGMNAERELLLPGKQEAGRKALKIMDTHLKDRNWLVADHYTIADIALYAYTHVADEGGFQLSDYPNVQRWLDRVASHPAHSLIRDS